MIIFGNSNFSTLQLSKLNDVWISNNSSLFSKSKYFTTVETNNKVLDISSRVLSYLFEGKNRGVNFNIDTEKNIKIANILKKIEQHISEKGIFNIPTGASIYHKEGTTKIYIKVSYCSKEDMKPHFMDFRISVDDDIENIKHVK